MKLHMNALIVVEGVTDVQKLTPWIDAAFITTNGSAISEETIAYIRQVKQQGQDVIVLTDPDYPGEQIRRVLDAAIPGLSHVFIDKRYAVANKKVGVAQANYDYLLQSLKHKVIAKSNLSESITMQEVVDLGLVGTPKAAFLRTKVATYFHLGHCNAKTMVKRLNQLGLTYDKVKAIL